MNVLVVGYGSIGTRHVRLLRERGCSVGVVSRRDVDVDPRYVSLSGVFEDEVPDFVVVANRTSEHADTLEELEELSFEGTALVEKPLAHRFTAVPDRLSYDVLVAYNLRFHPLLQRMHQRLEKERIVSVDGYAGQYLPTWRPDRDYRKTYSAKAEQGGGVLRDLSHELDYLTWLLGGWNRVAALGGQHSSLDIDSDDVFALLLETPRCPAAVLQLNYLDRGPHRSVRINTVDHTFELDLNADTLLIDGERVASPDVDRDTTYRNEHDALLDGSTDTFCTLEEGRSTLRLIEAVERSARNDTWISSNNSS